MVASHTCVINVFPKFAMKTKNKDGIKKVNKAISGEIKYPVCTIFFFLEDKLFK